MPGDVSKEYTMSLVMKELQMKGVEIELQQLQPYEVQCNQPTRDNSPLCRGVVVKYTSAQIDQGIYRTSVCA